jgi:hypothetical protein
MVCAFHDGSVTKEDFSYITKLVERPENNCKVLELLQENGHLVNVAIDESKGKLLVCDMICLNLNFTCIRTKFSKIYFVVFELLA